MSSPRAVQAAIDGDELTLHYQPIIELATGRCVGVEALLRWRHPRGGLVMPDDFLPAIAHLPVMREVTRWVLRRACADGLAWSAGTVSVNISASDVVRRTLVADVLETLDEIGGPPTRLTLELTEQAVVQDLPVAVSVLERLRSEGLGISLDDFGTGYSSLLYLRDLPITQLKIDRTFVSRLGTGTHDEAIVESVVSLGKAIGTDVVAEGVETAQQAGFLRAVGCLLGQGYLWSRPVAAAEVRMESHQPVTPVALARQPRDRRPEPAVATVMEELLERGASLHTIAAALNRDGLRTPRGTRWSASTVASHIRHRPHQS